LRNDYQDAIGLGQGVTEFNPHGQAADEVRRLWAWMEKRIRSISTGVRRQAETSPKRAEVSENAEAA
jgi:chromosome partitioning protein